MDGVAKVAENVYFFRGFILFFTKTHDRLAKKGVIFSSTISGALGIKWLTFWYKIMFYQ